MGANRWERENLLFQRPKDLGGFSVRVGEVVGGVGEGGDMVARVFKLLGEFVEAPLVGVVLLGGVGVLVGLPVAGKNIASVFDAFAPRPRGIVSPNRLKCV